MMEFLDNTAKSRFEHHVDDAIVFANYRQQGKTLYIDYVEAPPKLRGTGAAGRLMSKIVKYADDNDQEIVPICGYAASWLSRHK